MSRIFSVEMHITILFAFRPYDIVQEKFTTLHIAAKNSTLDIGCSLYQLSALVFYVKGNVLCAFLSHNLGLFQCNLDFIDKTISCHRNGTYKVRHL